MSQKRVNDLLKRVDLLHNDQKDSVEEINNRFQIQIDELADQMRELPRQLELSSQSLKKS